MGCRTAGPIALAASLLVLGAAPAGDHPDIGLFAQVASPDEKDAREACRRLAASWRDDYASLLLDLAALMRPPERARTAAVEGPSATVPADGEEASTGPVRDPFGSSAGRREDPSTAVRERIVRFLEGQTGQRFGQDLARWRHWLWNRPYAPHPDYAAFKAGLYSRLDPRMGSFFAPGNAALIRLDEVVWGGVRVNGIPPLAYPRHVPAAEAGHLGDKNIVFGIAVNGESRAYPKRILAWHEMARDRLGGVELTVVYCTLCGTVIPYGSETGGILRTFGTSGLLYRSNKLMFDEGSMSLWSSVEGRPVIGPLAGSGIELRDHPVVTTTWREWRSHPETTVLSLDTGFERDYSEGAAYRDYFATDRLMFPVPRADSRLKNKDEVLALLVSSPGGDERHALAIAIDFLRREPVLPLTFAGRDLVVLTSRDGANRVYESGPHRFARKFAGGRIEDVHGRRFTIDEDALRPEDGRSPVLPRLSARRAFWFGWYAQFPETQLLTAPQ